MELFQAAVRPSNDNIVQMFNIRLKCEQVMFETLIKRYHGKFQNYFKF